MVLTHMMAKKELNPMGWFLGLPLLVAAGWVWLYALYGTPIAHLAIVAGVLDILIGVAPGLARAKKHSDWVRDIEDGTNRKRQEERIKSEAQVAQQEYNENLIKTWMPDIYKKYSDNFFEFGKPEGGHIAYLGTPFWTNDDKILVVQPDRLLKFSPTHSALHGDRIEAAVPTTDAEKPVPADILVNNLGEPHARYNLEGKWMPEFNDFSIFQEMETKDVLEKGETAMGEAWIYNIGTNTDQHGIGEIERAYTTKGRHKPLSIEGLTPDQIACREFTLNVMYKRVNASIKVGLAEEFPAVAIFVSRDQNGKAFIEPKVLSRPLMSAAFKILSNLGLSKALNANQSGRTDTEKADHTAL